MNRPAPKRPGCVGILLQLGAIALLLVLLLIAAATYVAAQPRAELADCAVTEVADKQRTRRTLPALEVQSSCGTLVAPTHFRWMLEAGAEYDFTVRGWDWETPTIIEVRRAG